MLACLGIYPRTVETPGELTVATFNIHHGEGRDGVVDLERTAEVIRSLDADLVALQEVDKDLSRSGNVDQAAEIAARTGMEVSFFPALLVEQGEYGLALATKGPARATSETLPRLAREERRIAIEARYAGVSFVATHLSKGGRARDLQTEALMTIARRLDPPVIVLGDLNQSHSSLEMFNSAGFSTRPPLVSWRSFPAVRRVDHIVAGPGVRIHRFDVRATVASDHPVVRARVVVTKRGT